MIYGININNFVSYFLVSTVFCALAYYLAPAILLMTSALRTRLASSNSPILPAVILALIAGDIIVVSGVILAGWLGLI